MKKSVLASLVLGTLLVIGLAVYALSTDDIEGLVICATNDDASYIPSNACEYYLVHFRLTQEDIKYIDSRAGLSFLFGISDEHKKYRLLNYFIDKGVSVNKPSALDGLPPLHAAILENDITLIEFLLENGADPHKKDTKFNLTPEEFTDFLSQKNTGTDRSNIKKLFSLLSSSRLGMHTGKPQFLIPLENN